MLFNDKTFDIIKEISDQFKLGISIYEKSISSIFDYNLPYSHKLLNQKDMSKTVFNSILSNNFNIEDSETKIITTPSNLKYIILKFSKYFVFGPYLTDNINMSHLQKNNIGLDELDLNLPIYSKDQELNLANHLQLHLKIINDLTPLKKEINDKLFLLEKVNEISNLINSSLNMEDTLHSILTTITKSTNSETSSLFLFDEKKRYTVDQLPSNYSEFENKVIERVKQTEKIIFVDDITTHEEFEKISNFSLYKNLVSVPIIRNENLIGVLTIYSNTNIKQYVDFFKTITNHISQALLNAQSHHKLQEDYVRDHLTGLYNRKYFFEFLDTELEKSKRTKSNFAVAIIDIDSFSHYNNTNGHPAGDVILKELCNIIEQTVRKYDVVGRYGGEEFIIIFPEIKPMDAKLIAERLVQKIADHHFPNQEKQPSGNLTISMGLLCVSDFNTNKEHIIKEADNALYKAKNTGKNKVISRILLREHMSIMNL